MFLHILLAEINDTVHSEACSEQMDVEREEYHFEKQQRGAAVGCKRFLQGEWESAPRSPADARLDRKSVV